LIVAAPAATQAIAVAPGDGRLTPGGLSAAPTPGSIAATVAPAPAHGPPAITSTAAAPVVAEPRPRQATAPPPPPRAEPTAAELAFEAGWAALRAGDYAAAARSFGGAITAAPDAPLAEDARYGRTLALARAGRTAAARKAMAQFLARHPASARAGEVAAMLGWLLVEAGDLAGAERRFHAAAGDPDPTVQRSAGAGLAAVEAARQR
jgi:TolA-binding protein